MACGKWLYGQLLARYTIVSSKPLHNLTIYSYNVPDEVDFVTRTCLVSEFLVVCKFSEDIWAVLATTLTIELEVHALVIVLQQYKPSSEWLVKLNSNWWPSFLTLASGWLEIIDNGDFNLIHSMSLSNAVAWSSMVLVQLTTSLLPVMYTVFGCTYSLLHCMRADKVTISRERRRSLVGIRS